MPRQLVPRKLWEHKAVVISVIRYVGNAQNASPIAQPARNVYVQNVRGTTLLDGYVMRSVHQFMFRHVKFVERCSVVNVMAMATSYSIAQS